jgi:hypothetical protein
MNKTKLVLTALTALTLAGCATGNRNFNPARLGTVNLGMDKAQVLRLLGPPAQAATCAFVEMPGGTVRKKEALRYVEIVRGANQTNRFVVAFHEGKVADYGPEVGRLGGELEGVFADYPKESAPEPTGENR